jgi:hypothetical protein
MLRITRIVLAVAVALTAAAFATTALAAPAKWQSVDIAVQTDAQQQSMFLVSGELPPTAKLPQQAELAVPTGAVVQWVGEILGGETSADPTLEYTKTTVGDMDVYRFTLTKARTAQVEAQLPGVVAFDGTQYASKVKWTAPQAVPQVHIAQRIPQTAKIIQESPGATLAAADTGFSAYSKVAQNVKAGDVIDLTFAYTVPAAAATPAGAATTSATMPDAVVFLVIALVVALFVFVGYKLRGKLSGKSAAQAPVPQRTAKATKASASSRRSPAQAASSSQAEVPKKRVSPMIPTIIVVAVLVAGALIAGAMGTASKASGGKVTKNFGSTSECTSATIAISPKQGVDLAAQSEALLDSFAGKQGIGEVTVDTQRSVVDIGFCESYQTEATLRTMLESTGLVTTGSSQETSATGS